MFKRIMIPTDGSALAGKAVRAGIQMAKALGASDASMAIWVLAEGACLIAVGAAIGTLISWFVIPKIAAYSVTLSSIHFEWPDLRWVALAVAAIAILISLAPARQAWRVDTAFDLGRAA